MKLLPFFALSALVLTNGAVACAQHFHGGHHGGFWHSFSPYLISQPHHWSHSPQTGNTGGGSGDQSPFPVRTSSGYVPGGYGHAGYGHTGYGHPHHHGIVPGFNAPGLIVIPAAPSQPIIPQISVIPVTGQGTPSLDDILKRPPKPSTAAAKLKSMEHQAHGDEQLRKQRWAQAYMRYRSAIDVAGDRGEARLRQGFAYAAMQHYASAVREIKRGLMLEPELSSTGIRLAMLFGPDSDAVRTSILHKVANWVREDPTDSDRLFLLGAMLHYENDPRSSQVLKVARQQVEGPADHILTLLGQGNLHAAAGPIGKAAQLLELPPLPALAGAQGKAVEQGPKPLPPPEGLPPLSDRPMPPIFNPVKETRDL